MGTSTEAIKDSLSVSGAIHVNRVLYVLMFL